SVDGLVYPDRKP
ncbi:MAG: hypothetical protein K2N32_02255, partial [Clostridia bacterium]|nr:hypothetical protein [Clostridia bacterium]